MPDSSIRKNRARKIAEIAGSVVGRVSNLNSLQSSAATYPFNVEEDTQNHSFPLHPISRENLQELEASWPDELLMDLKAEYDKCQHRSGTTFPFLINIDHITAPIKSRGTVVGYHFVGQGEETPFSLNELAKNPASNVWAASFRTGNSNKEKQSTFFPRDIATKEALLALLKTGDVLRRGDNRLLISLPNKNFHVEALIKNNYIVWSCYPLLFFDSYEKGKQYAITESCHLSSETILQHAENAIQKGQTKYYGPFDIIVDIAKEIPESGVSSGIYIKILKAHLTNHSAINDMDDDAAQSD